MYLSLNLSIRQTQILALGIESDYAQSFFLRAEQRLRDTKFQRALLLLDEHDAEQYRCALDWMLGVCVPTWRPHIMAFYNGYGPRLGEAVDYDVIDQLDRYLDLVLVQLRAELPRWEAECAFVQETVRAAVRELLTYDAPAPPPPARRMRRA